MTARPTLTRLTSLLAALACLALTCALAGCGQSAEKTISNGLASDLASIKGGDTAVMIEYFSFDPSAPFVDAGVSSEDFAALFFKDLSISINSVEVKKDQATLQATITSGNYANATALYQAKVTQFLQTNGPMTGAADADVRAQAARLYLEALSDSGIGTVQTDVTLQYALDGKSWKLTNPVDLARAIFGDELLGLSQTQLTTTDAGVGVPTTSADTAEGEGGDGTAEGEDAEQTADEELAE